MGALSSDA
ncbi:hypothetical protein D043_4057A, partial [Vibrio parahaemolyticus EKP-021]